jgi:hypothetical protein
VLTITTHGEPEFVAGKTPIPPDMPYVAFVAKGAPREKGMQDVAFNRPTEASSEAAGHNGAQVLDGDNSTYWAAADDKVGAWWQVDLEQPHTINSIQINFPTAGAYRYKIEGSADGANWTPLVDDSETRSTKRGRTDEFAAGTHCQFVRITFTGLPEGKPAAISEVKIDGKHWP